MTHAALPSAPGPERFTVPRLWSRRPLYPERFRRAVETTRSREGQALVLEAEWPRLATAILNLPDGLFQRAGAAPIVELAVECGIFDFELGAMFLTGMPRFFRAFSSQQAREAHRRVVNELSQGLMQWSLMHPEPAAKAVYLPNAEWARHAQVLVNIGRPEDAPAGVKRGRAE